MGPVHHIYVFLAGTKRQNTSNNDSLQCFNKNATITVHYLIHFSILMMLFRQNLVFFPLPNLAGIASMRFGISDVGLKQIETPVSSVTLTTWILLDFTFS